MTIAVAVFFVGVLMSSVGFTKVFEAEEEEQVAPSALHQGVTLR